MDVAHASSARWSWSSMRPSQRSSATAWCGGASCGFASPDPPETMSDRSRYPIYANVATAAPEFPELALPESPALLQDVPADVLQIPRSGLRPVGSAKFIGSFDANA